jgi:hypothetical protein
MRLRLTHEPFSAWPFWKSLRIHAVNIDELENRLRWPVAQCICNVQMHCVENR